MTVLALVLIAAASISAFAECRVRRLRRELADMTVRVDRLCRLATVDMGERDPVLGENVIPIWRAPGHGR